MVNSHGYGKNYGKKCGPNRGYVNNLWILYDNIYIDLLFPDGGFSIAVEVYRGSAKNDPNMWGYQQQTSGEQPKVRAIPV